MAALHLNISKFLSARQCFHGQFGTLSSFPIVKRHVSTKKTDLLRNLKEKTKYGCIEVKSAGSVSADRRFASSCSAPKIARNAPADHDNSGSSGEEDMGIKKIDIRLPWTERIPKVAFLLTNLITPEECQRYIDITEQIGYQLMDEEESSKGSMCLWQSKEETVQLLNAMQPYIPEHWWEGTRLSGLHDVLHFERFYADQQSHPRRDGTHIRANGDRSYLTFQLFLNDIKEDGGFTSLVSPPVCNSGPTDDTKQEARPIDRVDIQPSAGSVLIFQNDLFYESGELSSGTKYTLKGEILYTMTPLTSSFDKDIKSVRSFFSGRPAPPADTSKVIQPTTWFFASNVPTTGKAEASTKPKGIPFYVPQKKGFIYVE